MKKTIIALAIGVSTFPLFGQGTVRFSNRDTTAGFFAPIYGLELGQKYGQSAIGLPSGTQTYSGPLLTGSGWSAQLFSAPGSGAPETSLAASPSSITTFRTGSAAGAFAQVTATLVNVAADAPVATLQVRVWDNWGGTVTSWAQAEPLWLGGNLYAGKSLLFEVTSVGGTFNVSPLPTGLVSFNINSATPEPSTWALVLLGTVGLLIFRRRK